MSSPVNETMSINTLYNRVYIAGDRIGDITANGYVGIGHNIQWTANSDSNIPTPNNSIDYLNQTRKSLVALKKLYFNDGIVVVQRVDWIANTVYTPFSNTIDMYVTSTTTNANGQVTTILGNTQIIGSNTTFFLDYANNDFITLPGDNIYVLPQTREVVNVVSNTLIIVNNAFTSVYTANVPQVYTNYSPNYAYTFYARNIYDQVFVCLNNNNGVESTDMPKISLGGQLPTNPYIIAADGYLWKYLYTISGGYKQSFFTDQWMPVIEDEIVESAAINGTLSIVNIINGGTGYNGNTASFNAPILTVTGDGSGANLSAQVNDLGVITGINVLNGGSGYTVATITANTGVTGNGAVIQAVIGPTGGWGSNAATELGATAVMISIDLDGTENGTIPTIDYLGEYFTYRQVVIVDSPLYTANGAIADILNFDLTTVIQCATTTPFQMGDIAFQGPDNTLANAVFQGTVVWFDDTANELHLNNVSGVFNANLTMIDANNAHTSVAVYSVTYPEIDILSGSLNFIENRAPVTRSPGQTENIKIVIEF